MLTLEDNKPEISALVAAYNEERTIGCVMQQLLDIGLFAEIIVVNDGSTDATGIIADRYAKYECVRIIHMPGNRGKGACIARGIEAVSTDYVAFQDADTEYSVINMHRLSHECCDGTDMVVGVRAMHPVEIFRMSWGSFIANKIYKGLTNIPDVFSGQRIVRTAWARSINLKSKGFEIETELTVKALKTGARLKFVPVMYSPRKVGKKIGARDFIKISRAYISLKLSRQAG